jgi:hypothetical protein
VSFLVGSRGRLSETTIREVDMRGEVVAPTGKLGKLFRILERETGLESVYHSHGTSLLITNRFFSTRHDGEIHFSSCLVLQNLGKSRK